MSVSECHVRGCPNVMCDYFSDKLQKYICDDCLIRLKKRGILNKGEILTFFNTEREPKLEDDQDTIEAYYNGENGIFQKSRW